MWHLRSDMRPILCRLRHAFWKRGCIDLSTLRTHLDFPLMLSHFQTHRRQIEHLALVHLARRNFGQIGLTMSALHNSVYFDVVWLLNWLSPMPFMAFFSTAPLATWLSPTLGR